MKTALHRKYRPKRISELDQTRVREEFERVLASGSVAQAYLFAGPRGTGKTSTARIIAAVLNCERNKQDGRRGKLTGQSLQEPCGKCSYCQEIRQGISPAVIEIDAASNRGIDDIRQLRERIGLMTPGGGYTVYIIDEVHMLTREAFNALLKTLEEPPKHVVFCLCTTELEKIPETIVSRCVLVNYKKASRDELERSLGRVVRGEKIKIEREALGLVAESADGSFRDGVMLLERLLAGKGKITEKRVREKLGLVGVGGFSRLYELMRAGEIKPALELVEELEKQGADMKLLAKHVLGLAMADLKAEVIESSKVSDELVKLVEVISKAFARFGQVPIAAVPMEMAIVEYGLGRGNLDEGGSTEKDNQDGDGLKSSEGVGGGEESKAVKKSQGKTEELRSGKRVESGKQEEKKQKERGLDNGPADRGLIEEEEIDEASLRQQWPEVLKEIEGKNHGLVTLLRGARLVGCRGSRVVLRVRYRFHKEQLEQERFLRIVEEVVGKKAGAKVRMKYEVDSSLPPHEGGEENVMEVSPEEDKKLLATVEEVFGV